MARRSRRRLPEIREASIEAMSHEGRGIARLNGKTVFVFGALTGERASIKIDKRSRKFDQASVVELIEVSPQRIEPRCRAYGICGGCSLQHLGADDQLALKQNALLEMMRHAGVEVGEWLPPLRAAEWGYRRKARLGVKYVKNKGRVLVGFRERNSPFIADMDRCEVLLPEVGGQLDAIARMIGELEAKAQIPQIEVAADAERVQLVFRHLQPLSAADRQRLIDFARESGFYLQLQPGGPDTVHDLYPDGQKLQFAPLADDSIRITFGALDFVQVNSELNQQMVAQAIEWLDLQPEDRVLDLFCGLGNFTLPLARRAATVVGVEGDAAMVARARDSARDNEIGNSEYYLADLNQPEPQAPWMRQRFDKILLDPPRSGAEAMASQIGRFGATAILYVSCQPSSLVRDAAIICAQGYRMTQLGIMDMFPQTAHVEAMAVFETN